MAKLQAWVVGLFFVLNFIQPIHGEVIGPFEYTLPKNGWVEVNRLDSKNGTITILYAPQDQEKSIASEIFALNYNPTIGEELMGQKFNLEQFKNGIENGFKLKYPNVSVSCSLIETTPSTVFGQYEIKNEGQVIIKGLFRVLSSKNGTLTIEYHTLQVDKFEELKPEWKTILEAVKMSS